MCLAVPGRVVSIDIADPFLRMAKVDFGGVTRAVSLACVPEAREGDYVIAHVGMALSILDQAEAIRVFEQLEQMGELAELEEFRRQEASPP